MGLAVAPAFAANRFLYVCYTTGSGGRLANRLARLSVRDGKASAERVLVDEIPGAEQRDGCRLKFDPDGTLYATTGDAGRPELAQRLDSLAGKILRLAELVGEVLEENLAQRRRKARKASARATRIRPDKERGME